MSFERAKRGRDSGIPNMKRKSKELKEREHPSKKLKKKKEEEYVGEEEESDIEWEDISSEEEMKQDDKMLVKLVQENRMAPVEAIFPRMTAEKYAQHYQDHFGFIPEWLQLMIKTKEKK